MPKRNSKSKRKQKLRRRQKKEGKDRQKAKTAEKAHDQILEELKEDGFKIKYIDNTYNYE